MSNLPSLEILKQHCPDLLLAEVAAWLHDVGKLSSQFIDQMSRNPSDSCSNFEHESAAERIPGFVDNAFLNAFKDNKLRDLLRWRQIQKDAQIGQLLDLILYHDRSKHSAFLVRLLNRWDGVDSGADKGTTRDEGLPKEARQEYANTFIATAFGSETKRLDTGALDATRLTLTQHVGQQLTNITSLRFEILNQVEAGYEDGLAETRRAANDVTLWCHSFSVATLYKTSLATFLVNGHLDINNLRPRILRVNFDALALYAKAIQIADLLAYQRAVEQACEQVKQLVEDEYPLGNEVYRDSTGLYFTFPDLDLPADLEQEIRRRVEEVEPELAPRIAVTEGDGPNATDQLKRILGKAHGEAIEALKQPFDAHNLAPCWQQLWEAVSSEKKWEVCPVCRLRPKEEHAETCPHCQKRRDSRLETWQRDPRRTIWVGEIADHNDRVALLVGKFGLEGWLSGDLVQTMLVKAEQNNPAGCTPKNPSPARLRRVWETCQRFWTETVEEAILAKHDYGAQADHADLRRARYLLTPDKSYGWRENFPYNGFIEVKRDGKTSKHPISLLWREASKDFITISDLQIIEKLETGQSVTVRDSDKPHAAEHTFRVQQARPAQGDFANYKPYLPLHASPDQFLALVPAADALKITRSIRDEYITQFGKVRNRLPLSLGLIFCERKMPLLAVMDAARQMLGAPVSSEQWAVDSVSVSSQTVDGKPVRTLTLKQGEDALTIRVPTAMGDNKTEDVWYPYFELEGAPAAHHTYQFQHNGKTWTHVKNLQKDDKVCLTPSRFDFLWLDAAARRFEIAYDKQGRRPARPTRPYYLEDLDRLDKIWGCLKPPTLTCTQLKQILQTIETTRERWFGRDEGRQSASNETFRQFVADTLANAGWDWKGISEKDQLITAGVRGELTDLEELHLEIL